jgi:RecA-family ATPase
VKLITQAEAAAAKIDASLRTHNLDTAAWPDPLDLEALADAAPAPPKFIMPDWLPAGYATLLAGHGGVGKSAIALHLAVCIAAGLPFFGLNVSRRRVLYLSCEDRENVLHWRLSRICAHLAVNLASLSNWLNIVDLVGRSTVLWERDPRTGYTVTAAYGLLAQHMQEHRTQILIVDGVTDTFAGGENVRHEVKRYINALVALIPEDSGAVLLVGHVAKPNASAAQTTEGYSGSTAWHNSVRARWYLYPETAQSDDSNPPDRTGDLILELQKSNLGRTDQSMRFAWDDRTHLFLGREIMARTASDRAHRDRVEHAGILKALKVCADANPTIIVPAATTGRRTAFHVLSACREFPQSLRGRQSVRRFWRHIESLRHMGLITEASYRRTNRHFIVQLVLSAEGMRQCAE